jgi:hypothetical protein
MAEDTDYSKLMDEARKHLSDKDYALLLTNCQTYFTNSSRVSELQEATDESKQNIETLLKKIPSEVLKQDPKLEDPHQVALGVCAILYAERS